MNRLKRLLLVFVVTIMSILFISCGKSDFTQQPTPTPVEVSFEIEPNTSHSIPVYLSEGQWLRVHYLLSPTKLGAEVIRVRYTHPGQGEVVVGGSEFDTVPAHGEGYYSIDFHYTSIFEIYDPEIYGNVRVYVRYEIMP